MHSRSDDCSRFDRWISQESSERTDQPSWQHHLETCPSCREQLLSHRLLLANFENEPPPELSVDFNSRLDAKLDTALEVRPLRGWRLATLMSYSAAALATLAWFLRDSPLASIDFSSPGIAVVALALVPVTQAVALWASRLLPAGRLGGSDDSVNPASSLLLSL